MTRLWAYLCWILHGHRRRPMFPPAEWESLEFDRRGWPMPDIEDPERHR